MRCTVFIKLSFNENLEIPQHNILTVVNTKSFVPSVNQMFCKPTNYPINAVHVYKYHMKLGNVVSKSIVTQFHNSPDPRIIKAEGFDVPVKVDFGRLKKLCAGKCKGGLLVFHSVKVPAKSRTCHLMIKLFNMTIV